MFKYHIFQIYDIHATQYGFLSWNAATKYNFNFNKDYVGFYIGEIDQTDPYVALEDLFVTFNTTRPEDFKGHSLSTSDIVKLTDASGQDKYYYCDSFGWTDITDYLAELEAKEKELINAPKMHRRAEVVRAMETIARCVNDEEVFDYWLSNGVADGDITSYTEDSDLECYCEDESFAELMGTFLKLMKHAQEDGLYCDKIVSK